MSENKTITDMIEEAVGDRNVDPMDDVEESSNPPKKEQEETSTNTDSSKLIDLEDSSVSKENEVTNKFKLELDPEAVVAVLEDGTPLKATEVEAGYLRQSDYTKKTQELATARKDHEDLINWWEGGSKDIVLGLYDKDMSVRVQALNIIAQNAGIDLGTLNSAPSKEEDTLIDLTQFDEESEAWELANKLNKATQARINEAKKVSDLEKKFNDFTNSLESKVKTQETVNEIEKLADSYKKKGLTDIDTESASKLVGQPMTPEQAMIMSHYKKILEHNIKAVKSQSTQVPNEPRSSNNVPNGNYHKKSVHDILNDLDK
jgi:hypothetical protein